MGNTKIKDFFLNFICFAILKVTLEAIYVFGTVIQYAYLGRYLDFNLIKYIAGWIFLCIFCALITGIKNRYMQYMVNVLFLLSGVSNLSIYGLKNCETSQFFCVIVFWLLLILGANLIRAEKKHLDCKVLKDKTTGVSKNTDVMFAVTFLLTIYLVLKCGVSHVDFDNAYLIRESFRQKTLSTIDNYLLSWNAMVFLPWCFLQYISKKSYCKCVICLIPAFLMFSINGMKTWLLIYVIVFLIYIMYKLMNYINIFRCIVLGVSALQIFSIIEIFAQKNYFFSGIMDRIMILPGEMSYFYMSFFQGHTPLYLRESILKAIAPSPYNPVSPIQISKMFMKGAYYHYANNGMLGDAYGNFKMLGVFLYPFIIVLSLYILYKYFRISDEGIKLSLCFILMWLLTNTSFFTYLMTGGYMMYLLIAYIHRKYKMTINYRNYRKNNTGKRRMNCEI